MLTGMLVIKVIVLVSFDELLAKDGDVVSEQLMLTLMNVDDDATEMEDAEVIARIKVVAGV